MRPRLRTIAWVVIVAVDLFACGKAGDSAPDARIEPDPAATVPSTVEPPRPVVTARSPVPTSSAHATARPPAASASAPASPAPGHPLAEWMRGPATRAFNSGDLESIASTFDQLIPWAPKGFPNWASIARDGGQAARAGSIEGVKAACRGCHAQYDVPYRATLSSSPLP